MKRRFGARILFRLILALLVSSSAIMAFAALSLKLEHRPGPKDWADLAYSAEPGPDVLRLADLIEGAHDDREALARVAAYYDANHERLARLWRIPDETRLRALFAMYLIHVSVPYGETAMQRSLLEFAASKRAHCGTYSAAQADIASALGLEWRLLEFSDGWHGWLEVRVSDQWEVFDSTVNIWIDQPMEALMQSRPRRYRLFWTPVESQQFSEWRDHLANGYNVPQLRSWLPCLGTCFQPTGQIKLRRTSQ
jgi:hypothetical protein